jgi:hypothetical protein
MPTKTREQEQTETFLAIAATFSTGLYRLYSARVAALAGLVAIYRAHTVALPERDNHPLWEVVEEIINLEYQDYDNSRYLSELSFLVYATTLFDTFLTETTRFLFLRHPAALGDDCPIQVDAVLKARSRFDLLNAVVNKRVRSIANEGFPIRIRLLKKTFGLRFSLPADVAESLKHCSTTRNTVVHDQAFYEVYLDSRGRLSKRSIRCPRHPTPVPSKDFKAAMSVYRQAVWLISDAILVHTLGVEKTSPEYRAAKGMLAHKKPVPVPVLDEVN